MNGNILILSAGRRVSLLKSFQQEVKKTNLKIAVICADANPTLSSACQIADKCIELPRVNDPNYIEQLKSSCIDNNIKIIIPTIDTELLILSKHKLEFEKLNLFILCADFDFITICRDKRLTHQYFLSKGINVANEMKVNELTFPVFVKPKDGSSSQHLYFANSIEELPPFVLKNERFMLLEFLNPKEHTEFTCDLYFNHEGILICAVPRKRIETRGGEVSKGITSKNFLVDFLYEKFASIPGARGCVTMQFFVNNTNNNIIGIEINPRFGGGFPLSYLAKANFPGWIIKEYLENKNVNKFTDWEDHLLMLRYDDEILVHDFKA